MPKFRISLSDGRTLTVDAPDQATAVEQVQVFIRQQQQQQAVPPAPVQEPAPAVPVPSQIAPTPEVTPAVPQASVSPQVSAPPTQRQAVPSEAMRIAQQMALQQPSQPPVLPGAELRAPQPAVPAGAVPTTGLGRLRQGVQDITAGMQQGLTLGFGDELMAGALTPFEMIRGQLAGQPVGMGDAYERLLAQERGQLQQARARTPTGAMAGEVVGATATGGAAGRLGARVMPGIEYTGMSALRGARPTMASMAGRGALEGTAYGGIYGFGTGEEGVAQRMNSALQGGIFGGAFGGAVGGAARGLDKAWNKLMRKRPDAIASSKQIDELATASYERASNAGVIYKPRFTDSFLRRANMLLVDAGYRPELQPRIQTLLNVLEQEGGQNITLRGVHTWRQMIGNIAGSPDRAERRLGVLLKQELDKLIDNPPAESVLLGRGREGAQFLREANELYTRARKVEDFERLINRAEISAARAENKRPFDAIFRSELTTFLKNPRNLRAYSEAEMDALKAVAKGPATTSTLEKISAAFDPTGYRGMPISLMGFGGVSTGMIDPKWMLLGAIGFGVHQTSRLAGRGLSARQRRIAQDLLTGTAPDPLSVGRQAVIRSLIAGGTPQVQNIGQ